MGRGNYANTKNEKEQTMKDNTVKVSHAVFACLRERLNDYAEEGRLVTPALDAAELLSKQGGNETAIAELKNRKSYSFTKRIAAEQRYRRNTFTDGTFSVSFWHLDAEGDWIFVPAHDDRFLWCDSPKGECAWKLQGYSARGEFRRFDQVASALGEANLLADAEMQAD